ncbi:MAG: bifunctional diaminohydroxyphosphoribosylaminopyrimidine deaminase/5-amino-6-(5-phosphoribosylamino)uracil reductase RibD [Saprospiraceae bacterium]|nr:bifunctional diaminohydroxyphosphoribosylaminopyrimidine deaminase/5-amino-6-(5-phosphoribosylamino)uracil reductase RibD [Saprospiraceae bacterium]
MQLIENEHEDTLFLQRCFDLARLGAGAVAPNPMVGAVVVHKGKIIGEGYHQKYGKAHAEVNAIDSIPSALKYLLPQSTLYVSLEPCCFFGNTPACTDLIIRSKIPKVVIAALDATPEVSGKGVAILKKHGIEVVISGNEGNALVRPRTVFVQQNRPYLILKYAQTRDGFIGKPNERLIISNLYTQRLVHKWRSEVNAILVGTNTAVLDNPQLNNRLYFGQSPIRLLLDPKGARA